MKAYVVVQETVTDEKGFAEYRNQVMPTITAHGGRFIVRGGKLSVLEGEWAHPRLVVLEFPSRAAAEGWYHSPEYQKIAQLQFNSCKSNLVIVDGSD